MGKVNDCNENLLNGPFIERVIESFCRIGTVSRGRLYAYIVKVMELKIKGEVLSLKYLTKLSSIFREI